MSVMYETPNCYFPPIYIASIIIIIIHKDALSLSNNLTKLVYIVV